MQDMPPIGEQASQGSHFRFVDLRTYADTEWLADNRKHYRQVFDRQELRYIYAELSLHNLAFERQDGHVEVVLVCYKQEIRPKQICRLVFQRDVSAAESMIYIREGWGNKNEGSFWKVGNYTWEAYVNGDKVGSRQFFVQDTGRPDPVLPHDYLTLEQVRIYEGPRDDTPESERVYLSTLDASATRMVYLEMVFFNHAMDRPWYLELITKFYTPARDLKGRVVKFLRVPRAQERIYLTVGWGTDMPSSWRQGRYVAELVFLDRLVGTVFIEMEEASVTGLPRVWLPSSDQPELLQMLQPNAQGLADVMARLHGLIGLHAVKKQIEDRTTYMHFIRLRRRRGFHEAEPLQLHAVFKGNPGTGKTTVAGMLGELYYHMGLLSNGHVHTVDRSDLVGEYIGQTAPKVRDALEKARGGVLFIDEAYALARIQDDAKDFGREVIEILVREMSDGAGDIAIIAAGYPAEMDFFLKSNPGLRSRFKMEVTFPDYQPSELMDIARYAAEKMEIHLCTEVAQSLHTFLTRAYRNRDKTFGNARFVYDLLEKAKIQMGLRIMASDTPEEVSQEAMATLDARDIAQALRPQDEWFEALPLDEELLQEGLLELESLIGLQRIKRDVYDLVQLTRYYLSTSPGQQQSQSMHTLLVGNPGTGKTTIARILAKIYKALGLLERGHVVETDRQGLVAGYVGQTALKTDERIKEAIGGVLFIDEAYSLTQSSAGLAGDYGDEAIQTLLKRMEDQRGKFFVFAAGYPDNMERFLKANPGLKSRFDITLVFDDYSVDELLEISAMILGTRHVALQPDAESALRDWMVTLHSTRDRFFGNARVVRQLLNALIKAHETRIARMDDPATSPQSVPIDKDTVCMLRSQHDDGYWQRQGIGFRT
jgi:SpoVK/Ycf46/Vps4 family AAA+-type ATPase